MDWVRADAARSRQKGRRTLFAAAASPRNLLDSVRRRLIVLVLLALTPLAGLNIVQGVLQWRTGEEEARQRLLQHAASSASSFGSVLASAENVLQALKTVEDVGSAAPACAATLHGAVLGLPFVANIAVMNAAGDVVCSALPVGPVNVSLQPWWTQAKRQGRFVLSGPVASMAAKMPVLVGVLPQTDVAGQFSGAITMAIDQRWLDNVLKRETPATTGVVAVFSPRGEILATNSQTMSESLFAGFDPQAPQARLEGAADASGRRWTFATADLDRSNLVVAFALPSHDLFGWRWLALAASIALPVLFTVISIVALWLAVDRVVLRWLTYLRRVAAVYAQGHYSFRPIRFDAAPSEFRVLGHAVENMAAAVRQRDARLREGLAEKTALVREIHHRIKNSLQVVVSLLSLYGSGIDRPEYRQRFDQLRTRVNTLALVHRLLYEASDGSQVRFRELLRELGALLEGASDRTLKITVRAADAAIPTDMAVPLALMVVEIVLGLGLPVGRAGASMVIGGELEGDQLLLTVTATWPPGASADALQAAKGPAMELAHGFAGQLGGELARSQSDGEVRVTGTFPCRAPAPNPPA